MAITKVTEGVRTLGTGEVATANMATDPTNASNLSSGSVPLAQLGNVDTSGLEDDIAILGFKVASNGSLAKYDLVDQTVDDFQDASGVDASNSTNEYRSSSGKYYSGAAVAPTGGTITTYSSGGSDYTVHSFLADGNFVTTVNGNVDYLIVAGGGAGGGGNIPGGGGAGGLLTATGVATTAQTYAIVVGSGGTWNNTASSNATSKDGGNSSALSITATGGGGGGSGSGGDGASGGSGGGWHGYNLNGSGNTGIPGQGNDGGMGQGAPTYGAAGGGGAGAVGDNGGSPNGKGGDGGVGLSNSLRTGSAVFYAGGGGGQGYNADAGLGGNGGGGRGRDSSNNAVAGTANTGGGGGASDNSSNPADGGSGIVVIRFVDGVLNPKENMTLISNSTTAQSTPTKGDIVMTYTNGAGTATVNTDLKAYVSRDDGTTYTQVTLASQGTTGGHTILTAHDVDISGQPSGTSMRYKITTHNQSASKETRIQAVSLGWS